jgi:hypothetical protein
MVGMARRRRPNCAAMPPLYQETAHTRLKLGTPAARRPLALAGLRLQTLIAKITSLPQTGRRLCFCLQTVKRVRHKLLIFVYGARKRVKKVSII